MGCSTVAVNLPRHKARAFCDLCEIPANRNNWREPTSGLEPLTCSLRVIHQALQGLARSCDFRISKAFPLLRVARRCTVLRSRWYQSGIKKSWISFPASCMLGRQCEQMESEHAFLHVV